MNSHKDDITVEASNDSHGNSSGKSSPAHAAAEEVRASGDAEYLRDADVNAVEAVDESKKGRFAYFKTKEFYTVMVLGYV
jgi:hypothetical protein